MSDLFSFEDKRESEEDVEKALAKVRQEGVHKKNVRRASIASVTAALLVVIGVTTQTGLLKSSSDNSQIAAPVTTSTTALTNFNPVLASEVIAKVGDAYDSVTGISGTSTQTNYCSYTSTATGFDCDQSRPTTSVVDFRFRAEGDAWVSQKSFDESGKQTDTLVSSFQAKDGAAGSWGSSYGDLQGVAFGQFPFYTLLNGLSIDKNATLTSESINGIDTWSIHAKGFPIDDLGVSPDEVVANFDKSSLFPVKVDELRSGMPYASYTVSNLKLDPKFSDSDFVAQPSTAPLEGDTVVIKPVNSQSDLKALTSYTPLVATEIPSGFSAGPITFTADAKLSGGEGLNTHNKDLVEFNFNKGLRHINMTTREFGPGENDWVDPLSGEGKLSNLVTTSYTVSGGAYNGVRAEMVTGFGEVPHVWIVGSTTVTEISGDLSTDDLKAMLASVQKL